MEFVYNNTHRDPLAHWTTQFKHRTSIQYIIGKSQFTQRVDLGYQPGLRLMCIIYFSASTVPLSGYARVTTEWAILSWLEKSSHSNHNVSLPQDAEKLLSLSLTAVLW